MDSAGSGPKRGACSARVAVVTGASRGIGRAVAQRLAAEGAAVAVTGRTARAGEGAYPGSLEETVALIEAGGGRALAVPADLADADFDHRGLLATVEKHFGASVDILVNNAAAERRFDIRFATMDLATFTRAVTVNVWAGWALAVAALPAMRAKGEGWILNVSSRSAAPKAQPYAMNPLVAGQCLYAGTKAMLDRLTTGAAMELYDDGIAVNALAPEGSIATDNAVAVAAVREASSEPVETFAEAALALCTGDPAVVTGRVAYSLSLLVASGRPVYSLDGGQLIEGWQPAQIDGARLFGGYLLGAG